MPEHPPNDRAGRGAFSTRIEHAFARLRDAWRSGRPIVPLFGAGISACASIPFGPHIVEYMIGVQLLCERVGWRGSSAEYLLQRGWPEPNELYAELAARCGPGLREAMVQMSDRLTEAAAAEIRTASGWLALIQHLTGGRKNLIEAYFDGIVRNRRPGNAHQFIAYLAKLVGWRLIFTTNFDDLIERALREDGLHPVVYELVEGGTLPDAALVRRHLSVIKLHGGAFGLRAGFDLAKRMDETSIDQFTQYVPKDALILVLGQGGREERVLSLPLAWLDQPAGNARELVWLHYEKEAPAALDARASERIITAQYGDASLFLHELYQRLAHCHPVGRETYRGIYHLPERLLWDREHAPRAARDGLLT